MIEAAEPLSLVLWSVFFLAAGMYPLGLMLGAPCSPCCKCEEVLEFNRCIRFVNTIKPALRTEYSAGETVERPLHGYSRHVTRPEQIGVFSVPAQLSVPFSVVIRPEATSMSDGETRSASYEMNYRFSTLPLEEAGVKWAVTLRGVTLPMSPPSSLPSRSLYRGGGLSLEYRADSSNTSKNTPVFVSVHSCRVVSGEQWIDGSSVTEEILKGLLSVSFAARPADMGRIVSAAFTATSSVFQYLPPTGAVVLSYVIEHARGATRRYTTWQISLDGLNSALPIPSEGLPALNIQERAFSDTPFIGTTPEFSGDSPTAMTAILYSDNVVGTNGNQITFPSVTLTPQGRQMRYGFFFPKMGTAEYLLPQFGDVQVTRRSLIMRPTDPGIERSNIGVNSDTANPWIYDSEVVESFLKGESTVTHIGDGTFTMQASEPTAFCGYGFCRNSFFGPGYNYLYQAITQADALERTVTCKLGRLPLTWTSSDEKGTATYTNGCYGQDDIPPFTMPLSVTAGRYIGGTSRLQYESGCAYVGSRTSCQTLFATHTTYSRSLPADTFYCGDLLWVIENGPCRTSLTIPQRSGFEADVFTLGGNEIAPIMTPTSCAGGLAEDDTCYVSEVEVNVSGLELIPNNVETGDFVERTLCASCDVDIISTGVGFPGGASEVEGTFVVPGGSISCIGVRYASSFVINGARVTVLVNGDRVKWCDEMKLGTISILLVKNFQNFTLGWVPSLQVRHPQVIENPNFDPGRPESGFNMRLICDRYSPACSYTVPEGTLLGSWYAGGYGDGRYTASYEITGLAQSGATPTNAPSVSPRESTVPSEGGTVPITFCCPPQVRNYVLTQTSERYARTFSVQGSFHSTAYITQAGYDGTICPFTLAWLTGDSILVSNSAPGRQFSPTGCPLLAQVNHEEQPACDWSVESSADWIVAEQTDDGLLKISLNGEVEAVFSPPDRDYSVPYRRATITITSGDSTGTWEIFQLQR